jgi:hypothetical protein
MNGQRQKADCRQERGVVVGASRFENFRGEFSTIRVFRNRRPGLRLKSVLVEMKEDSELLVPAI